MIQLGSACSNGRRVFIRANRALWAINGTRTVSVSGPAPKSRANYAVYEQSPPGWYRVFKSKSCSTGNQWDDNCVCLRPPSKIKSDLCFMNNHPRGVKYNTITGVIYNDVRLRHITMSVSGTAPKPTPNTRASPGAFTTAWITLLRRLRLWSPAKRHPCFRRVVWYVGIESTAA